MKVLVPLNRSDLVETAVPAVRKLLGAAPDAELYLFQVLDPRSARGSADREPDLVPAMPAGSRGPIVTAGMPRVVETHGEALERLHHEAEEWLQGVVEGEFGQSPTTVVATWSRDSAKAIVAYADSIDADVIVMATHARGGIGHLVSGSVTEDVIRTTPRPVLVVGPAFAG